MARSDMRGVVLWDDGDPDAAARAPVGVAGRSEADAGGEPGGVRELLRQRRTRLAAGGVVLVVAVAAVAQWNSTLSLSSHSEALHELKPTLTELWRAPFGAENHITVNGDLFVAEGLVDGRHHVVAVDTTTGARRWAVPPPDAMSSWIGCDVAGDPGTGVNTHVVCRVVPNPQNQLGPTQTSLYVLDARTGDVMRRRPLANENALFAGLGTDLLVVDTSIQGHLEATREDPATGEVLWSFRSALPLPLGGRHVLKFEEQHGYLVADGPTPVVLSPEGSVLWEWGAHPADMFGLGENNDLTVLDEGKVAIGGDYRSEPPEAYGNVKTLSGKNLYPIPGPLLTLEPDDGTASDLLLTASMSGEAIIALNRESGDERWRTPVGRILQALVVDRRLLVHTGSGVLAVDTRNGRILWETAGVTSSNGGLWTDGRLALLADVPDSQLTALDVADGRVRWAVPTPDRVRDYIRNDGRLYLAQPRMLTAFG